jgi:gluconokinase
MRDLRLRSPYDKLGGLFYFGRMLDKLRRHVEGELPPEYEVQLGKGFDERCATFLRVRYELVVEYVNQGLPDGAILESCFAMGHRPSEGQIDMWNEFMRKRGWHDDLSETLERQKKEEAMLSRSEIQTLFEFIDADEGRLPALSRSKHRSPHLQGNAKRNGAIAYSRTPSGYLRW